MKIHIILFIIGAFALIIDLFVTQILLAKAIEKEKEKEKEK